MKPSLFFSLWTFYVMFLEVWSCSPSYILFLMWNNCRVWWLLSNYWHFSFLLWRKMGVISRKLFPACESMCVCCPALRSRSRQPVKRYKKLLAEIFPKSPVSFIPQKLYFGLGSCLVIYLLSRWWLLQHTLIYVTLVA